jgi:plasmid segregation protein ParM
VFLLAFWDLIKKSNETTNSMPKLAGVDLGYGQVKVFSNNEKIKFLSAIGTPVSDFSRVAAVTNGQELLNSLTITYEGQKYYVGHNAIINSRNGRLTLRQNKSATAENKVKLITALALMTTEEQTDATFDLITGLPVLEFKNQKDELYNSIYNNGNPFEFQMHYGPNIVDKKITIRNVKVISQGEGAFYDYVLSSEGTIREDKAAEVGGTVMVVDPGYRTIDVVTMENGRYIEPLSDQINRGVFHIHQEILRLIMERLNVKKELREIDEITRSGELFYNKKIYNIQQIIEDAVKPFANDVVESLYTISNDTLGSIQKVILTGGGSSLIYPYVSDALSSVVEVALMENAEFSNASGYHKYGLLLKSAGAFN